MMNLRLAIPAVVSLCAITGCHAVGRVYPVQGPITAMTAPPLMTIKVAIDPLRVSLTLASGERFSGPLKNFNPSPANLQSATPLPAPPQPNLAFAWDAVYGQGFYVAHVLGNQFGQAVLTGNQGTVVQVELSSARGVAIDNKGNLYKLVFSPVNREQYGSELR